VTGWPEPWSPYADGAREETGHDPVIARAIDDGVLYALAVHLGEPADVIAGWEARFWAGMRGNLNGEQRLHVIARLIGPMVTDRARRTAAALDTDPTDWRP